MLLSLILNPTSTNHLKRRSEHLKTILHGFFEVNWKFKEISKLIEGSGSNDVNSQLGLDFAIGSPYGNGEVMLALSLPTKALPPSHFWDSEMNQAGSVHLYSMDKLGGNITTDDIQAVTTFNSDQGYARYGWDVGFYDLNNVSRIEYVE